MRSQNYSTGGVPRFMSQIMRLRVILDTEDDVFRDIDIATDAPLMHLHFAVLDAFGGRRANLRLSSKATNRGAVQRVLAPRHERPMADDGAQPEDAMNQSTVGHLIPQLGHRAIYVYDFLRMWCFTLSCCH